jgi:hypothetical protein
MRLQPGSPQAREGLTKVEAGLAADDFAGLRREGASLEAQERWHEARDAYRRVLTADGGPRFAQQGARRAGERAELSDRLDGYLEQSSRLGTPAVRREAERWLSHARALDSGPVLRSQVARIELLLREFDRPAAEPAR